MKLDKFYTKKDVAQKCFNFLKEKMNLSGEETFLEPTAGNGAFLDFLVNYEAYDIKPEDDRIIQKDIFDFNPNKKDYITIGNPPFGKRSKLAIAVFNHCASFSEIIAFILPVSFMKYGVQKELNKNFKLIDYFFLDKFSFLDKGKDYNINCVFQIWTTRDGFEDLRRKSKPPVSHKDFKLWQYNKTKEAFSTVDEDWDYAVLRQGYGDYKKLYIAGEREVVRNLMDKKQFFFIKPLINEAKEIVLRMDFENLAMRNTSTPGFGKADFIEYYEEIKKALN